MKTALNFTQQDRIFEPGNARPVTVIGAGSVGSQLVVMLARVGCADITVWDDDEVAPHNVPMSAYGYSDVCMFKVEALRRRVLDLTGVEITAIREKYAGGKLKGSVVSCVDSMAARHLIWERVKNRATVDVFIDTRLHELLYEVYRINPCNAVEAANYEAMLFPQEDAEPPMCGQHGIVTTTSRAASAAASRLTATWSGRKVDWLYRESVGSLKLG